MSVSRQLTTAGSSLIIAGGWFGILLNVQQGVIRFSKGIVLPVAQVECEVQEVDEFQVHVNGGPHAELLEVVHHVLPYSVALASCNASQHSQSVTPVRPRIPVFVLLSHRCQRKSPMRSQTSVPS